MISTSPAATNAAGPVAATAPLRVAVITIAEETFKDVAPEDHVAVLWEVLGGCVIPAEQRTQAQLGNANIPAALVKIDVTFPDIYHAHASILGPLTTDHPALVCSLQILRIVWNRFDESAALAAFAALATDLQELTFWCCGLTSLRGLDGRCEYLRKVDLGDCEQLNDIDGLSGRVFLDELDVSETAITSIDSLRTCPNLTRVQLSGCRQLSSIQTLEGHQRLQEVYVGRTPITSIDSLRSCPRLTKVHLYNCQQLSSIEALQDHPFLQEVDASFTPITTIEPLRSCPSLTGVHLYYCRQLSSIEALKDLQCLQIVNVSETRLTTIHPLHSCPALAEVYLEGCEQLPADVGLPASVRVFR